MSGAFQSVALSDPAFEQDGLSLITVKSRALKRRADATVWSSRGDAIEILLILLHGVYRSHWVWTQKAGIHRMSQRMIDVGEIGPMVIMMPSDGQGRDESTYLPYPDGEDAGRWIVEETPIMAHLAVPALSTDAKLVIDGLSMGGYGALRLGAKYSEKFAGISAHSAITEITELQNFIEEPLKEYLQCGSRKELSALYWLEKHSTSLPKAAFRLRNRRRANRRQPKLHNTLLAKNIPHIYEEFAGGHAWSYWQQHAAETLRFASNL